MVNYLQLYCTHYGPGARPFAYVFLYNGELFSDFERDDATYDWIAPLDRLLKDMPENATLYTFNSTLEQKKASPLLSKEAILKLSRGVDLYKEIKSRTTLVPLPSYSMESLSRNEVILGPDLRRIHKESREEELRAVMEKNIRAMERIGKIYEDLVAEQSCGGLRIDSILPSPFTVIGSTTDYLPRYIQRGDLLYEEREERFQMEIEAKWLPYDAKTQALVVETDAPVVSKVDSPPGYLIFALGEEVFYSTILEFIRYLREEDA